MVIATEKFSQLARQSAVQSGLPDARIVTVAHPIGGVKRVVLAGRADAAVEEVMSRLLGSYGREGRGRWEDSATT